MNKKKIKKPTKFDALVKALVDEFIKIPNIDLASSDPLVKEIFNRTTFRIAELHSYKALVCQHFFPATNKVIFEARKDFEQSEYKFLLDVKTVDFSETLYDTVRLAYVGLFHKIENFVNDIIQCADLMFQDPDNSNESVLQWAKKHYQFNLKDWQQFSILFRINWICNCVKHKDGYPRKLPKPSEFERLDESKRIRLTPEDFKADCEILAHFYSAYMQIAFLFGTMKFGLVTAENSDYSEFPDLQQSHTENLAELKLKVEGVVKTLKDLHS